MIFKIFFVYFDGMVPSETTIDLTPSQLDMEWQPHLKKCSGLSRSAD